MPDPITPTEPVSGTGSSQQQVEDYKPRFDGAVRKIEELTLANRQMTADLVTKASELEQLRAQLGVKDVEKTVAIGERDKQLQESIQSRTALESEVTELRGLKVKIDTVRSLGRPELLKVIDKIPNMSDPEALKVVLNDLMSFADEAVTAREKQLLSGITPTAASQATPSTPSSEQTWTEHINALPLGSIARKQAMDKFGDWLEQAHK